MEKELQAALNDLTDLTVSLADELEVALLEKSAAESTNKELKAQIANMQKLADVAARDKVILEKVASHGIADNSLIPVLEKLEKVGFIKSGASKEAFDSIKRRPDYIVGLLTSIAESFTDDIPEGYLEKQASTGESTPLPKERNAETFIDHSGWSRLITEGA